MRIATMTFRTSAVGVISRSRYRLADDSRAGTGAGQGTVAAVGGRCTAASDDRTGVQMGTILLLALAAAVYPQLLAVVVVILTRPGPKPLLRACYVGSLFVALGCGIALLAIFRSNGTVAGTSSKRLGPSAYLVVEQTPRGMRLPL